MRVTTEFKDEKMAIEHLKTVLAARRQQRLLLGLFTVVMATAAFAPRNERALLLDRGMAAPVALAALTGQPSAIAYSAINGGRIGNSFAPRAIAPRTAGGDVARPGAQAFVANLIPLPDQTQSPSVAESVTAPSSQALTPAAAGGTGLAAPAAAGPSSGTSAPNLSIPNPGGANPAAFSTPASTLSGVPEPATWVSMMIGFLALGAMLRRRSAGSANMKPVTLHRN